MGDLGAFCAGCPACPTTEEEEEVEEEEDPATAPHKGRLPVTEPSAPEEEGSNEQEVEEEAEEGDEFRPLPKKSCDADTKAAPWYSYGSRAEAEAACKAEGCKGLGTKEEQIAYGSQCTYMYSSDEAGFYMKEKAAGCGNAGWNNGAWKVKAGQDLGAFCAGCPACPPEFRPLPKKSCDAATKAAPWYSYGSRAEAEAACKAEGSKGWVQRRS